LKIRTCSSFFKNTPFIHYEVNLLSIYIQQLFSFFPKNIYECLFSKVYLKSKLYTWIYSKYVKKRRINQIKLSRRAFHCALKMHRLHEQAYASVTSFSSLRLEARGLKFCIQTRDEFYAKFWHRLSALFTNSMANSCLVCALHEPK